MDLTTLLDTFKQKLEKAEDLAKLTEIKIEFLGKKGAIQALMQSLKDASKEERPQLGKKINDCKALIEQLLHDKEKELQDQADELSFKKDTIDVTLPGKTMRFASKHPIQQMMDQMLEILISMGFTVEYGPEIESEYYNFESLNFPPEHPARDMQDTFYITSDMLLRTHTSNIQARIMESKTPPLRIIAPGRVYRNETITYKSHVFFHQIEAFYVDKQVTFTDLIHTL
jgi:phenylalanyl-tRNA synthetase alpha chain